MNDYTLEALQRRQKLFGADVPEYDRVNPAAIGMGSTGYSGLINQQFDTKKPVKQQKQDYPEMKKMDASRVYASVQDPREEAALNKAESMELSSGRTFKKGMGIGRGMTSREDRKNIADKMGYNFNANSYETSAGGAPMFDSRGVPIPKGR